MVQVQNNNQALWFGNITEIGGEAEETFYILTEDLFIITAENGDRLEQEH